MAIQKVQLYEFIFWSSCNARLPLLCSCLGNLFLAVAHASEPHISFDCMRQKRLLRAALTRSVFFLCSVGAIVAPRNSSASNTSLGITQRNAWYRLKFSFIVINERAIIPYHLYILFQPAVSRHRQQMSMITHPSRNECYMCSLLPTAIKECSELPENVS